MTETPNKKTPTIIFVVMAVLLLMTSVIAFSFFPDATFTINDHRVSVVRADSSEEREKGLSGRERLGEQEGMLFVFDSPGPYCFWMKDMNFPIDMIWLNQDKQVISVSENVQPDSYPTSYCPDGDATYVLEVKAGKADQWNIKPGDKAQFKR